MAPHLQLFYREKSPSTHCLEKCVGYSNGLGETKVKSASVGIRTPLAEFLATSS
jgi:hypothetical protein